MWKWFLAALAALGIGGTAVVVAPMGFLPGFGGTGGFFGSGVPPALTSIGCTENSAALTTYTYAAHATGTAGNRTLLIVVHGDDTATNYGVSTLTVGGVAAAEQVEYPATSDNDVTAVYSKSHPTGTSDDIVVTFTEAIQESQICVWDVKDLSSITATATATDSDAAGGPLTLDIATQPFGVTVAGCTAEGGSAFNPWVGATERDDQQIVDARVTSADFTEDATSGTPTLTCDSAGGLAYGGASAHFR